MIKWKFSKQTKRFSRIIRKHIWEVLANSLKHFSSTHIQHSLSNPQWKSFSIKLKFCDCTTSSWQHKWESEISFVSFPKCFIAENQERLYLLLIISATSGVILCLFIIAVRWLLISRRRPKDENSEQGKVTGQFKSSNTGETTITNGFSTDDISEIDADIDLTTPLPMSSGSGTRNDVSLAPCLHNFICISTWRKWDFFLFVRDNISKTNKGMEA